MEVVTEWMTNGAKDEMDDGAEDRVEAAKAGVLLTVSLHQSMK
jgi:hypothetical protein